MCVLETIWYTIQQNCVKGNKCVIEGVMRWKVPWRSNKKISNIKLIELIIDNENCFRKIKVLQMKEK